MCRPVCPCVPFRKRGGAVVGREYKSEFEPILGEVKIRKETKIDNCRRKSREQKSCRLNTGSEPPAKSLKFPQCGDFLQTLAKSKRHWFVTLKRKKGDIPLEKRRFYTGTGASSVAMFMKGEQNERRI